MNDTWITADPHLGEDRFEIMGRAFTTAQEHVDTLVANHNALVKPEDTVIVNGDACYQRAPQFLPQIACFNGRKILIRGNHDRIFTDADFAPYFETIIAEGQGMEWEAKDGDNIIPCYITHYPTQGRADRFNLTGHVHGAWKYQLNMFNVGVDTNCMRPVNMNKIANHFAAVAKFYDADVWVAYNDLNKRYYDTRGKKSCYFTPAI
jgi:calcineurin-like phosphoesterase family protein